MISSSAHKGQLLFEAVRTRWSGTPEHSVSVTIEVRAFTLMSLVNFRVYTYQWTVHDLSQERTNEPKPIGHYIQPLKQTG